MGTVNHEHIGDLNTPSYDSRCVCYLCNSHPQRMKDTARWNDPNVNALDDIQQVMADSHAAWPRHPALSLTPLEMEELLKKYEHCGITPEQYAQLREMCSVPKLIEGKVIE